MARPPRNIRRRGCVTEDPHGHHGPRRSEVEHPLRNEPSAGTEGRVGEDSGEPGKRSIKPSDPILGKDGVGGSIPLDGTILPYISMALTDETARNCSEPFANVPLLWGKVGKMLALVLTAEPCRSPRACGRCSVTSPSIWLRRRWHQLRSRCRPRRSWAPRTASSRPWAGDEGSDLDDRRRNRRRLVNLRARRAPGQHHDQEDQACRSGQVSHGPFPSI